MKSQPLRNPHSEEAVTIDHVGAGDTIVYHQRGDALMQHVTIIGDDYIDDDGNRVIEVQHFDGHTTVELTSTLGLTPDRYSGEWSAVAMTLHVPRRERR